MAVGSGNADAPVQAALALTSGTAISVAVYDAGHGRERAVGARHEMRTLQTMAAGVDDDGVFALERRVIQGEVLGTEVCGVVVGSRRAADEVDKAIHS